MTGFPGLGLIVAVGIILFTVLTNMIVVAITFWKMRRWLKGSGMVIRSKMVERRRRRTLSGMTITTSDPMVVYEYEVSGRAYRCNRIRADDILKIWSTPDSQTLARYPCGAGVDVHYNPANPEQAILEKIPVGLFAALLVPLVLLAVVFWLFLFLHTTL